MRVQEGDEVVQNQSGQRILVVGDVIDDVVVRPLGLVTQASDTPAEIVSSPGGSGANLACWLGALGVGVRFAGRVGATAVDRHTQALRASDVEAHLAVDPTRPAGTIVVVLDEVGERTMYVDRGANLALEPADLPDSLLDGVTWLHVSGYSLFAEPARSSVLGLVRRARRRGIPWSVDPSSVAFLRQAGPAEFLTWTQGAAVCLPNRAEASVLAGMDGAPLDDPATVAAIGDWLAGHYPVVAVKLGAEGVLVRFGEDVRGGGWLSAPRVDVVRDTTGAGDAFAAGFLSVWVRSGRLREDASDVVVDSARAGLSAAALALGQLGGRPPHTACESGSANAKSGPATLRAAVR